MYVYMYVCMYVSICVCYTDQFHDVSFYTDDHTELT